MRKNFSSFKMISMSIILGLILSERTFAQKGFTCLNENSIRLSEKEATVDRIQRILNEQTSSENQIACRTHLRFDSFTKEFLFSWGPTSKLPTNIVIGNVWIETILEFRFDSSTDDSKNSSYIVEVDIVCTKRDYCEKTHIIDRFQNITSVNYVQLMNAAHSISYMEEINADRKILIIDCNPRPIFF